MARHSRNTQPERARCAVAECDDEATGFFRMSGSTVVVMVGRPRSRSDVPLCTAHTWTLIPDMVGQRSA